MVSVNNALLAVIVKVPLLGTLGILRHVVGDLKRQTQGTAVTRESAGDRIISPRNHGTAFE